MFTSACVTGRRAPRQTAGRKWSARSPSSPVMTPGQAYQVAQIFVKLAGQDPGVDRRQLHVPGSEVTRPRAPANTCRGTKSSPCLLV